MFTDLHFSINRFSFAVQEIPNSEEPIKKSFDYYFYKLKVILSTIHFSKEDGF
jgi:hypothetical protein